MYLPAHCSSSSILKACRLRFSSSMHTASFSSPSGARSVYKARPTWQASSVSCRSSPAARFCGARWSRVAGWRSPLSLRAQISSTMPVLERFERKMANIIASENPFKAILTSLPKPGGRKCGKYYSLPALSDPRIARNFAPFRLFHDNSVQVNSEEHEVVIALGSNVGDRLRSFDDALTRMKQSGIKITRHACLYETEPAYVLDQPHFLNSAVRGTTQLEPHKLLVVLKEIERDMGRTDGIRYGPRPIDLDILFYGNQTVHTDTLTIPHERIWERPFVLGPLVDLLGSGMVNDTCESWHVLSRKFGGIFETWKKLGGESLIGENGMKRVMPIANRLWNWSSKTSIMGILNITPDSFSDGGKFLSVESAVSQVRSMLLQGADIIDLGAQSTRPMASRLSSEQELDRLIPVLEAVRSMPEMEGRLISVDTFLSEVALEAVNKGAHLINDVSGGNLDESMLNVIASLKVPYVSMHMRGDPCTMQNRENLVYKDVCADVACELYSRVRDAELSGIPSWRIILDPGIGFSKNTEHNLDIIAGLPSIRSEMGKKSLAMSNAPLLLGPSRKRFLGEICGQPEAAQRDSATVSAVSAGILGGANIVRVHNVRDNSDAARLCDAMLQRKRKQTRAKLKFWNS